MSDVNLYEIERNLNNMQCPTHHKNAKAEVSGESILISDTCCDEFAKTLQSKYISQIDKQILSRLNNLFG